MRGQSLLYRREASKVQRLLQEVDAVRANSSTAPPSAFVTGIRVDASVTDAASFMLDRDVGYLLVVNFRGQVCGLVTERDILRRYYAEPVSGNPEATSVRDIMSSTFVTVGAFTPVFDALSLMRERRLRHLPVLRFTSNEYALNVVQENKGIPLHTVRQVLAVEPLLRTHFQDMGESLAMPPSTPTADDTHDGESRTDEGIDVRDLLRWKVESALTTTSVASPSAAVGSGSTSGSGSGISTSSGKGVVDSDAPTKVRSSLSSSSGQAEAAAAAETPAASDSTVLNACIADRITVADAVREMQRRKKGSVLVLDTGENNEFSRYCGIFTEKDFVRRVVARELNPEETLLTDVMTPRRAFVVCFPPCSSIWSFASHSLLALTTTSSVPF